MSKLIKPYIVNLYEDVLTEDGKQFQAVKLFTIGANDMTSQFKVVSPTLTKKVSGERTLAFTMYDYIYNSLTGKKERNPFIPYLVNERRVGLEYKGKKYFFLIKDIKVDSEKKTYSVTAEEAFINELSKNGFNIELNQELSNNQGTATELAAKILEGSDWAVSNSSEKFIQRSEEALVKLQVTADKGFAAYHTIDRVDLTQDLSTESTTIPNGAVVYGFYSSCTGSPYRFQFIYCANTIETDDDRIIINKDCQYYIDGLDYKDAVDGYVIPVGMAKLEVSKDYRGDRYVYSPRYTFSDLLDSYLDIYTKDGKNYGVKSETTYKAPVLVKDYTTNGEDFKSTSGWVPCFVEPEDGTNGSAERPTIELKAFAATGNELYDDIVNSRTLQDDYKSTLVVDYKATAVTNLIPTIANSCIYDNRKTFGSLIKGKQYVVEISYTDTSSTGIVWKIVHRDFDSVGGYYKKDSNDTIILVDSANQQRLGSTNTYYKIFTVAAEMSEKQFLTKKFQLFVDAYSANDTLKITSFHIYDYIPKDVASAADRPYYVPTDTDQLTTDNTIITNYSYYLLNDDYEVLDSSGAVATDETDIIIQSSTTTPQENGYVCSYSAEKIRSIEGKESNRFNLIQSICETFECWADIDVTEENGIFTKQIVLKNYIGQDNYAGFKYGVNLKGISRTDSSKSIVSKLIVKQNSNEFGTNGFCTIARAPSNYSGENYLYDFSYYVNQGLLGATDLENILYVEDENIPCSNYFYKVRQLNKEIDKIDTQLLPAQDCLTQTLADYQVAKSVYDEAVDTLETYRERLRGLLNVDDTTWSAAAKSALEDSDAAKYYMQQIATARQLINQYSTKMESAQAQKETYEATIRDLTAERKTKIEAKSTLNTQFYQMFSRFIQEGTWIDENYYDDEKYYIDAQSTLYNSAQPAVSYSINVIAVDGLDGYEGYGFEVGDKTFIEDTEFFGYKINGNEITEEPYHEEITVTETSENLDNPSKNTIKVQTYKNQFADLFKRITATVQSVKYTTGAYQRAAALAEADTAHKLGYLNDALHSASLVLQNMGAQSVYWDESGVTIQDSILKNNLLRLVSQGLLITKDGGNTWKTAITSDGIVTDCLTAGVINTSKIQVMSGTSPAFIWNIRGIHAYKYEITEIDSINKLDYSTYVRFDQYGLYGIKDIADFRPESADEVMNNATFALTWDGLKIKTTDGGNALTALIGKMDAENGKIPIIKAGYDSSDNNQFKVYGDGSIYANAGTIGGWEIQRGLLRYSSSSPSVMTILCPSGTNLAVTNNDTKNVVFGAGQTGTLHFAVDSSGAMYATAGRIGNWNITNGRLEYKGADSNLMGMAPDGVRYWVYGYGEQNCVFYAGSSSTYNLKFAVTKEGILYATGAVISGEIKATSGTIGGWNILSDSLSYWPTDITKQKAVICPQGNIGAVDGVGNIPVVFAIGGSVEQSYNFAVDSSGNIYAHGGKFFSNCEFAGKLSAATGSFSGSVTATEGKIGGWTIGETYLRVTNDSWTATLAAPMAQGVDFISVKDSTTTYFAVNNLGDIYGAKWNLKPIRMTTGSIPDSNGTQTNTCLILDGILDATLITKPTYIHAKGVTYWNGSQYTFKAWSGM